jgi:hypothetical protein
MMTKLSDKINAFKAQYPTLTKGVNDEVIELTAEEYETTIAEWAQNELDAEAAKAEKLTLQTQKDALLQKLGLTQDEATLLLTDLTESTPISLA